MQTQPSLIRLALVDDHAVVRRGMRSYLEAFDYLTIVGEAANAEEALEQMPSWKADVIIMDLLLPGGMDGIQATQQITALSEAPRVVVLTAYTDDARAIAALRAGATGYVRKDARPEFLLEVIRAAARGEYRYDPSVTQAALQATHNGKPPLTAREMEVAKLVAKGYSNRQVAAELVLSEETIKSHVANILAKLQLHQRSQVTIYALREGWVQLEEIR